MRPSQTRIKQDSEIPSAINLFDDQFRKVFSGLVTFVLLTDVRGGAAFLNVTSLERAALRGHGLC
jgi:hypothetical protein